MQFRQFLCHHWNVFVLTRITHKVVIRMHLFCPLTQSWTWIPASLYCHLVTFLAQNTHQYSTVHLLRKIVLLWTSKAVFSDDVSQTVACKMGWSQKRKRTNNHRSSKTTFCITFQLQGENSLFFLDKLFTQIDYAHHWDTIESFLLNNNNNKIKKNW